ncbi:MAG: nucleotidyltransferase domain-containing protein [Armatimonadetes bacterium]|nr:nucleotidyltransferase domain-containing protein [Armatimonadota bacterium]MDW8122246.1 nucleotidyltransferase domain-containing protein [Armatimonadota bacterium]
MCKTPSVKPRWYEERLQLRHELLQLAQEFVKNTRAGLGPISAWLYGSVARGDFKPWSDVDVLVVAQKLPDRLLERIALLQRFADPQVQFISYTVDEFLSLVRRHHPNLMAILDEAQLIADDLGLMESVTAARSPRFGEAKGV